MLTGRLSISKQGLAGHLPACTAVVAAVEPTGGQLSAARTLQESVKLPASLIACFDMVFVLQDTQPAHTNQTLGIETGERNVTVRMSCTAHLPTNHRTPVSFVFGERMRDVLQMCVRGDVLQKKI